MNYTRPQVKEMIKQEVDYINGLFARDEKNEFSAPKKFNDLVEPSKRELDEMDLGGTKLDDFEQRLGALQDEAYNKDDQEMLLKIQDLISSFEQIKSKLGPAAAAVRLQGRY